MGSTPPSSRMSAKHTSGSSHEKSMLTVRSFSPSRSAFQQHLCPHLNLFGQRTFFPLLCVAQHTLPYTVLLRLKGQRVVGWLAGTETKISMWAPVSLWNSNRACITLVLLKTINRSSGRVVCRCCAEYIFPNFALLINQQFGKNPVVPMEIWRCAHRADRSWVLYQRCFVDVSLI